MNNCNLSCETWDVSNTFVKIADVSLCLCATPLQCIKEGEVHLQAFLNTTQDWYERCASASTPDRLTPLGMFPLRTMCRRQGGLRRKKKVPPLPGIEPYFQGAYLITLLTMVFLIRNTSDNTYKTSVILRNLNVPRQRQLPVKLNATFQSTTHGLHEHGANEAAVSALCFTGPWIVLQPQVTGSSIFNCHVSACYYRYKCHIAVTSNAIWTTITALQASIQLTVNIRHVVLNDVIKPSSKSRSRSILVSSKFNVHFSSKCGNYCKSNFCTEILWRWQ
jgi:hypothetical protein